MNIPERLVRIARFKLTEIKDRLERFDEAGLAPSPPNSNRREASGNALRELEESLTNPPEAPLASSPAPSTGRSPASPQLRTPQEIAGGYVSATTPTRPDVFQTQPSDALAYHYQLLGVQPGAEFAAVQAAYNKLAARCEPSRFAAGSQEAEDAAHIRKRLEDSFRALREALDPTARRFDLLEFDSPVIPPAQTSSSEATSNATAS